MPFPTPHLEKLNAALVNEKLPPTDKPRIERALEKYHEWTQALDAVSGNPSQRIRQLVALLNEYRLFLDVEIVFDSEQDFLYRQKGQMKLDNSVIEEFLPRLVQPPVIPEIKAHEVVVGPTTCFSSVYFQTSLDVPVVGAGLEIRSKDQDFAISKRLFLKASHDADFSHAVMKETHIGYVLAECKTNLDKTMFQEACATAHDVKSAVSGARYYLLCEWLDMTPLSTAPTDIDEILILRVKGKRINSNVRKNYATFAGRQKNRAKYRQYLVDHPFNPNSFERFVGHIRGLLLNEAPVEKDVLNRGYF
jgi:Bpu10I restriction endonuclease